MLYPEKERIQLHSAFILHHRPYRNTSLLLDVLTEEHGRISLIAKGAKQSKSKFRGCLQPFQQLSISWVKKTGLGTLTHAEITSKTHDLQGESLYAALYLNEVLTRVLEKDDPVLDIFHIYAHALAQLQVVEIAQALRVFEYNLLQALGFEIQLDFDAEQDLISENLKYKFIPEHGFVVSTEKNVFLFEGRDIISFRNQDLNSVDVLRTAQHLMRSGLKKLLGEKPLKSRELFKSYRKMKTTAQ